MTLTLPTEPYTVIRVTKATPPSFERTWVRGQRYWSPLGEQACFTQDEAEKVLLEFDVLAVPVGAPVSSSVS